MENIRILDGQIVELVPLERSHFPELEILSKNKGIWEFYVLDGSDSKRFLGTLDSAMMEKEKGRQLPFVIFHKQHKKLIGGTRLFFDVAPMHKKIEIGWTWLHPDYWASAVNLDCKLLLLTFCFEKLGAIRVQLKTDENNIRSRKAIEKIGARFEGVLRNEMLRDNGTKRNSAYYSIIDTEWQSVKKMLTVALEQKQK